MGQNRRYKLGFLWAGLISVSYYLCLFRGTDINWYIAYSKDMTLWFGIIIGGLSLTDFATHIKGLFSQK